MKRLVLFALLIGLGLPLSAVADDGQIAHIVFFELSDDTPENRDRLVASCQEHLSGHDGVVFFAVGTQSDEFQGQVNDRDFDVALHLVFESAAALKAYTTSQRHMTFLRENMPTFAAVRVFDSVIAGEPPSGD